MMEWLSRPAARPCRASLQQALERQRRLTKPPGSLGRLELAAVRLASLQKRPAPSLERVAITVFAADHGVAAEGVSAFPRAVTVEMVRNFAAGGAAINVLAKCIDASLEVVDVGTATAAGTPAAVISARVGTGTCNFTVSPAMNHRQLAMALAAGQAAVDRVQAARCDLFIGGEMGIANTTAASALACALLKEGPEVVTGPGTGLDEMGVAHKCAVIRRALLRHAETCSDPLEVLRCLGGFEIAALAGAYIRAAQAGLPVLVDGFIAGVAALTAARLLPDANDWFFYAHRSAEPGHRRVLEALDGEPLLDLDLRLGEASGAALAVPLLRAACALHNDMATFDEAGVSTQC